MGAYHRQGEQVPQEQRQDRRQRPSRQGWRIHCKLCLNSKRGQILLNTFPILRYIYDYYMVKLFLRVRNQFISQLHILLFHLIFQKAIFSD